MVVENSQKNLKNSSKKLLTQAFFCDIIGVAFV